jgi:hypothetical protein
VGDGEGLKGEKGGKEIEKRDVTFMDFIF